MLGRYICCRLATSDDKARPLLAVCFPPSQVAFDTWGARTRFLVATAPRGEALVLGHGGDSWELEGTPPCFFFRCIAFPGARTRPRLNAMCQNQLNQRRSPSLDKPNVPPNRAFSLIEALIALTV